jgi:hypothetical protein
MEKITANSSASYLTSNKTLHFTEEATVNHPVKLFPQKSLRSQPITSAVISRPIRIEWAQFPFRAQHWQHIGYVSASGLIRI